jgi:hypothetical protein
MIKFRQKGDFSKLDRYFRRVKGSVKVDILDKYGRAGVAALSSATPVDTGLTASSWYYTIEHQNGREVLNFNNSHLEKGVSIAIILQYGHGTGTGGWVEGTDYINPAIRPVFDKIAADAWKEVTSL